MSKIHSTSTPRQCSNTACGHTQRITSDDLFTARVPGPHGGSRNAPAFRCSLCLKSTAVDPRFFAKGALERIPSEQDYNNRLSSFSWESQPRSRNLLMQRIEGAMRPNGYALAYIRSGDKVTTREITLGERTDLLSWLDNEGVDLLLISGIGSDGRRWRTLFHPTSGASPYRGTVDPAPTTIRAILTLADFPEDPLAIAA